MVATELAYAANNLNLHITSLSWLEQMLQYTVFSISLVSIPENLSAL